MRNIYQDKGKVIISFLFLFSPPIPCLRVVLNKSLCICISLINTGSQRQSDTFPIFSLQMRGRVHRFIPSTNVRNYREEIGGKTVLFALEQMILVMLEYRIRGLAEYPYLSMFGKINIPKYPEITIPCNFIFQW